ncbi:hypothetical protein C0995_002066 [Termitomyces sp. Mi166|nr:hypothetical protein C0995_002066 [Termitomyces sp. Mi166\
MSAAQTSIPTSTTESQPIQSQRNLSTNSRKRQEKGQKKQDRGGGGPKQGGGQPSARLRGLERDSPAVRLSKTISWLLRHGAKNERLPMRPDGYVKVKDLTENLKGKGQDLEFSALQELVKADSKKRFDLKEDEGEWWIRANQGHSIELKRAYQKCHGTTYISRKAFRVTVSSVILIFLDIQKALDAGIEFFLSDNGVVLSQGRNGIIPSEFFLEVRDANGEELVGWKTEIKPTPAVMQSTSTSS